MLSHPSSTYLTKYTSKFLRGFARIFHVAQFRKAACYVCMFTTEVLMSSYQSLGRLRHDHSFGSLNLKEVGIS